MQKWEYLFQQTETVKEVDSILADAGDQGWELVNVAFLPSSKMSGSGQFTIPVQIAYWNFFFKRPKP
jgi:hypothetical protein